MAHWAAQTQSKSKHTVWYLVCWHLPATRAIRNNRGSLRCFFFQASDTNNKVKEISFLIHLHLHHGRHHRCSSDTSELNGLNFGWIGYTKIVVLILDNFRVLIWKKAATVAQPCGQMKMRTIYLMGEMLDICAEREIRSHWKLYHNM